MVAEFGYPVPTLNRDTLLNQLIPALEEKSIFSRGRFGGWKYEAANMDHSVMQGVEAVERILQDKEEVTWARPNVVNAGKR
jgi:UDP-galactopyranose mutase